MMVLFAFTLHQGRAVTNGHQFIILIIGAVDKGDNALGRAGFAGAGFGYFCSHVNGIAVKDWVGEFRVAHTQIAHRSAQRGIPDRYANHQAKGENRIDQWLAKFGVFRKFMVDVQGLRIQGHIGEQHIVALGDCAAQFMLEHMPDNKFIKI